MADPVLLVDRADGIGTLTLNRPRAMNALSRELRAAIAGAFRELREDRGMRVAILTGAGDRAFCAGLDLKELSGETPGGDVRAFEAGDMIQSILEFDRPVIGAVNGVAITGGFELALACDVLIASRNARFADTHARVGIVPGWGLSQRLPRLVGSVRAKHLSFTGNFLPAERAEAWGLVTRVVEPEELMAEARTLASDMASCDPDVLAAIKHCIDAGLATTLAEGLAIETRANRAHAANVTPEKIAARRGAVMERGRSQHTPR